MSHAHVIVQRVPVSLPWAWNSLLMYPPKYWGRCNSPKAHASLLGATAALWAEMASRCPANFTTKCLNAHVSMDILPGCTCLVDTYTTSFCTSHWFNKNIFKENNVILRHMAYRIMHIISYISYLQTQKKICPFPTASEHCPHLHCQLFL